MFSHVAEDSGESFAQVLHGVLAIVTTAFLQLLRRAPTEERTGQVSGSGCGRSGRLRRTALFRAPVRQERIRSTCSMKSHQMAVELMMQVEIYPKFRRPWMVVTAAADWRPERAEGATTTPEPHRLELARQVLLQRSARQLGW